MDANDRLTIIDAKSACMAQKTDEYSEQEAQERFETLVQVALKTPPKPQKIMGYKGVPAQRKKGKKRARKAA